MKAIFVALLLILSAIGASAQDVWPEGYQNATQDGPPTQSPADWQEQAISIPSQTAWGPFQCAAPNSNYYSTRMANELRQCLDAHAHIFAALHQLFPRGIGYQGDIRWSLSIDPNGWVARVTPAAAGKPDPDYLRVAALLLKEVRFGDCRTCPTERFEYVTHSSR